MSMVKEVPITARPASAFAEILDPEDLKEIEQMAREMGERFKGRVVWHVNSTPTGGGVAEMLHSILPYVKGLGVDTRWLVIGGRPDFFGVTKRLHNALHGEPGDGSSLGDAERTIYQQVIDDNATELCSLVGPRDFVVLHDPQTAGLIPHLVSKGTTVVWRCHIGDDRRSPESDLGWSFLAPYLTDAHGFIFSRSTYVPEMCDHGRSSIVAPCIDPFSPKNQHLDEGTVRAILVRTGLVKGDAGPATPGYTLEDGSTAIVSRRAELTSMGAPAWETPLVVQVSRWDRLKDPVGVMEGFSRVAESLPAGAELVLAGPGIAGAADDPEGAQVFDAVSEAWWSLPVALRRRVHLANLPMDDLRENAAIVNALQRHAAIVVQKSLREGFGLTVTEAMWKSRPLIASAVGGIQDQIEHETSGLLVGDPADLDQFGSFIRTILGDPTLGERLGSNARSRVTKHFLGTRSLMQYADLIRRLDRAS